MKMMFTQTFIPSTNQGWPETSSGETEKRRHLYLEHSQSVQYFAPGFLSQITKC